jgi:glycerate-2-kinase
MGKELATIDVPEHTCFIWGGETTVLVNGDGEGGRNQEMMLSAANRIVDDRVVVAAASDGWDNTDVAGAIADKSVRVDATKRGILIEEHLARNDSYPFWRDIGGAIKTGRTGINVADFCILLRAT